MKKLTRSEFACNVTLLSVLACTAIHFLVITLNLFGAIKISLPPVFDYIVAYVLIAACLALYIFGFSITKFKSIMFPAWLRIMFYIAFFMGFFIEIEIYFLFMRSNKVNDKFIINMVS